MNRRCWVYRVFDADGRLLYIGSTTNLPIRFRAHGRIRSRWLPYAARVTVERFDAEADARAVEAVAIIRERPYYNVEDNRFRTRGAPIPPLPTPAGAA